MNSHIGVRFSTSAAEKAHESAFKFESCKIVNQDAGAYETSQADRNANRDKVGVMGACQLRNGQSAILLTRGKSDQPALLGSNPWYGG